MRAVRRAGAMNRAPTGSVHAAGINGYGPSPRLFWGRGREFTSGGGGPYAPPPICVATRVSERLRSTGGGEAGAAAMEPSRTAGMAPSSSQA